MVNQVHIFAVGDQVAYTLVSAGVRTIEGPYVIDRLWQVHPYAARRVDLSADGHPARKNIGIGLIVPWKWIDPAPMPMTPADADHPGPTGG